MSVPYLKQQGNKKILMVHDKPFIMLAGELHNSNSATPGTLENSCRKAAELGMNSVVATLSWELIEPEEGKFDFSTVDMVIGKAREYGLKLELIWFASWKNAQCYYAPAWVKRDLERFPRAQMEKGKNGLHLRSGMAYSTLSYLGEDTCRADAKAFRAVMEHIREIDSEENTVLMIQVENETGVMGAAREQSDLADERFNGPAPQELVQYMKAHTASMAADVKAAVEAGAASGTWTECFGPVAEEVFSAYHVSSYVNQVAAAGKEAYNIPMSVNAWLEQGKAGEYPSGGPVGRMMEVWQCCAPAIDIFAPDIYVRYFCDVCDEFTKNGNPLFIPECATHSYAGVRELYTVGHHHAVCYAPFGYEDIGEPFTAMQGFLFGMDVNDPALQTPQPVAQYRKINELLGGMMDKLGEKLGTDDLQAVISERPEQDTVIMGSYGFKFMTKNPMSGESMGPGAALVLKESEDVCYLLCLNCLVVPFSADPAKPHLEYLDFEEGHFEDGKWQVTLRRNGDEAAFIRPEEPVLFRMRLFAYGD